MVFLVCLEANVYWVSTILEIGNLSLQRSFWFADSSIFEVKGHNRLILLETQQVIFPQFLHLDLQLWCFLQA